MSNFINPANRNQYRLLLWKKWGKCLNFRLLYSMNLLKCCVQHSELFWLTCAFGKCTYEDIAFFVL